MCADTFAHDYNTTAQVHKIRTPQETGRANNPDKKKALPVPLRTSIPKNVVPYLRTPNHANEKNTEYRQCQFTCGVNLIVESKPHVRRNVAVGQQEGTHPARPCDDHLMVLAVKVNNAFHSSETHRQQMPNGGVENLRKSAFSHMINIIFGEDERTAVPRVVG